jgi:hypothetical protein
MSSQMHFVELCRYKIPQSELVSPRCCCYHNLLNIKDILAKIGATEGFLCRNAGAPRSPGPPEISENGPERPGEEKTSSGAGPQED